MIFTLAWKGRDGALMCCAQETSDLAPTSFASEQAMTDH